MIIKYNKDEKGGWKKEVASLDTMKHILEGYCEVKKNERIRVTFNPYNRLVARVEIWNNKGRKVKWIENLTNRTEKELKDFIANHEEIELLEKRAW